MVLVSIGTAPVSVSMANLHLGVRPPRPEGFMTDRGWQKLCKGLGNSRPRRAIGQATRPFARSQSALHYGRMTEGGASREKLPEEGEEAGAGAEAIVGIAGEVVAEHFFLVEEAEDDQRDDEEEARLGPPGAKCEGREEQHENSAEIHGMTDEAIGSRGDDFVPFFDLDGARGETVLFHDPQGDEITGEDQELGKNRQPKRDTRPAETVIQSREQQGPKENHLSPSNDGFLLAALFLCAQAALHQLGIALQEIN